MPERWVDYSPGRCNLLISASHGGNQQPQAIQPRICNECFELSQKRGWPVKTCSPTACGMKSLASDLHTQEIAATVVSELTNNYNCSPHYVRANIHRSRLDPNRDIGEAAQGDPLAEAAWHRYHTEYMTNAVNQIANNFGRGLVVDIHGQTHSEQWTEIGMLLRKDELNGGNFDLQSSSIRGLSERSDLSALELVSGESSFGGILSAAGYKVVPSPAYPYPGNGGFFSGGFITRRYGSVDGGFVDAIQVEINSDIRRNATLRRQFSFNLARAIYDYMRVHHYA